MSGCVTLKLFLEVSLSRQHINKQLFTSVQAPNSTKKSELIQELGRTPQIIQFSSLFFVFLKVRKW